MRVSFTGKTWGHLNKMIRRYTTLGYRVVYQHKHPDGGTTIAMER